MARYEGLPAKKNFRFRTPRGLDWQTAVSGLLYERGACARSQPARGSYLEADGWVQPHPAPRFAGTKVVLPKIWQRDSDRMEILAEIIDPDRVAAE